VALVRNNVSEEHAASIISVTRIGKLGATLAVTGNQSTLVRQFVNLERKVTLTHIHRQHGDLISLGSIHKKENMLKVTG
jgi:hypothetical protein